MVQRSDYNIQRSQEYHRIKTNNCRSNSENNSTNNGVSSVTENLQSSPNGQPESNNGFSHGIVNNNNINKVKNKQTVGDKSCCGCSCGINKNANDTVQGEKEDGEAQETNSPTISSTSSATSTSISHGRHLPHRNRKTHSLDAADYSFFSPSTTPSFFSGLGSSIHSANSFLWSWFGDHKEKQNRNYGHPNQQSQLSSSKNQDGSSSLIQEQTSNKFEDKDIKRVETMLSTCYSIFPLSSSISPQFPLTNASSASSSSSSSPTSFLDCRSRNNCKSNNINAQSESDSSGISSTTSSDNKSSSIRKFTSINKKTTKRSFTRSSNSHAFENRHKTNVETNPFLSGSSSHFFPQSVLFLLSVFIFWNSLHCDFVFDDITAIKDNKDLRPHVPLKNLFYNDFWGTPMIKEQSHKSYRPLTVLTFRINYLLGGLEPIGYHLVNILLHGLVTILYFQYLKQITSEVISFIAALMFALHPIHTEAVTGIVGRAELLASIWYLLALLTFARSSRKRPPHQTRWLKLLEVMMYVTLAVLCKEQGITVVAVCLCHELFINQKLSPCDLLKVIRPSSTSSSMTILQNNHSGHHSPSFHHQKHHHHYQNISKWVYYCFTRMFALVFFTIILLISRIKLMGGSLPVFTRFDNPAAVSPAPTKQLTFGYLFGVNAWLLLHPCDLICDWTMGTIPLIESFLDPRNMSTVLTIVFSLALIYSACASECKFRKHSSLVIISLAMSLVPFLPASNLFFPVGFVVAERCLYLPSMGTCLLVSMGFQRILTYQQNWKSRFSTFIRGLSLLAFIVLLIGFGAKTVTRNWDWKDEFTLFNSGLRVTKNNAKLFNNVGHALESKGDYSNALRFFTHATKVEPSDIGGFMNVGRIYNHLKMYEKAEEMYIKAKSLLPRSRPGEVYQARVAPNHLNVFINLASLISKNKSRLEEADNLYRQAISMRADYTQAYINRGDILLKLNRTKEALGVYEKALSFEQDNPDLLYNMGVVLLNQGNHDEALLYLDKALEYDPDHYQALLNSAILIQESGYTQLNKVAQSRLMRIVQKSKTEKGSNAFRTGQQNQPLVNERVYFNLGMLSMDNKDLVAAEHWFKLAVEVMPDFRSALFNLALLLSESGRAMESAPILHQLIRYHPNHVKGLILLGDLYVNQLRDLEAAEKCYHRILDVEPDNIQARHNLCVVMVEAGQLLKARNCLVECLKVKHENYIVKHIQIIEERLGLSNQAVNHSLGGAEDR